LFIDALLFEPVGFAGPPLSGVVLLQDAAKKSAAKAIPTDL
jgi:hypothetical protein